MTRRASLLLLAFAGLAVGGWLLVRAPHAQAPQSSPSHGASSSTTTAAPARPALAAAAQVRTGPRYAPFNCAAPAGDAARIDDLSVKLADVCARLHRIGAVVPAGTDREQARHVLARLVDATLVRRALAREHNAVTDAELTAALGAMQPAIGADVAMLTEQLRERLELAKLAEHRRADVAVTEQDVDAELAAGAPGIDRGQGMRVEGFLARTAPAADAKAQSAARTRAIAFAKEIGTSRPDLVATRHGLAPLASFVIGESGLEPELEAAAFALPAGQWSAPLHTRVGYVVIRVVGREPGVTLDDRSLRARVRRALENRKRQLVEQRILEELRAAARIEYVVDV